MFKLFKKDPKKKLNDEYLVILEKANFAQRNGDIRTYSELTAEANKLLEQIDALD